MTKRIILAGFWSHSHCEESFSKQITEYGMDVISFKISNYFNTKWNNYLNAIPLPIGAVLKINREFLALVKSTNVDYVFLWNCNHFFPSTLQEIRARNIKIIVYNNDDPYGSVLSNKKPWIHFFQFFWFLKSLFFADIIFVYRPVNIKEAAQYTNTSSKIKLFKPYFIPSEDKVDLKEKKYKQDVIFIGHYEDDNRLTDLEYLFVNNVDLKVYGTGWENRFTTYKNSIYPVYGEDYINELRGSKICLSFLSKMNRDVYTRRCFEIPSLGKLLLCERTLEMQELFKEDEEAVYFGNKQELLEKIEWLLSNPSKIDQISEAGYKRAYRDGHDIKSRSIEILNNL